jgi:hypothetical protein
MSVSISAKFSEEEVRTLDKIARDLGLLNRSDLLIREAVRFYHFDRLKPVVPVSTPREMIAHQQEEPWG